MGCIEINNKLHACIPDKRLIETWDVLKLEVYAHLDEEKEFNRNMGCIEIRDFLRPSA